MQSLLSLPFIQSICAYTSSFSFLLNSDCPNSTCWYQSLSTFLLLPPLSKDPSLSLSSEVGLPISDRPTFFLERLKAPSSGLVCLVW